MVALSSLWLPILLSAVLVFVASSIIHMATPWHKGDYLQTPNEDKVMEALRAFAIPPGDYMMPKPADMKDMKSKEFCDKMEKGPVMMFTVMPGGTFSMGKNLVQWFVFSLVVGFFAAYVTAHALSAGAPYLQVFRMAGADRIHRLFARTVADVDLVSTVLGHDAEVDDRRLDLRAPDRGRIWLVVAALSCRCETFRTGSYSELRGRIDPPALRSAGVTTSTYDDDE